MDEPLVVLERLLEAGPQPGWESMHIVRESGDFYDSAERRADADNAITAFITDAKRLVAEVENTWGPPRFAGQPTEGSEAEWAYWRGFVWIACWPRGEVVAFVGVSHEDAELPVLLLLGVETRDAEPAK